MKIRVYYEDTDTGGVVYHSNYLNFCERARSELFFQKGLSPHKEDEFFVVKSLQAEFIKPAKLGDILEIKTTVLGMKKASIDILQEIFKDDNLLFKTNIKVAFLKGGRPNRIPDETLKVFL